MHGYSRWMSLGDSGAVPVLSPFYVSGPLIEKRGWGERERASKKTLIENFFHSHSHRPRPPSCSLRTYYRRQVIHWVKSTCHLYPRFSPDAGGGFLPGKERKGEEGEVSPKVSRNTPPPCLIPSLTPPF